MISARRRCRGSGDEELTVSPSSPIAIKTAGGSAVGKTVTDDKGKTMNAISIERVVTSAQRPLLFAPGKMDSKIDLPRSQAIPSDLKEGLILYRDHFGGSLANAYRRSAIIGNPILLQVTGLLNNEYLRNYAMTIERMSLIQECVMATGVNPMAAYEEWSLEGLYLGQRSNWQNLWREMREARQ